MFFYTVAKRPSKTGRARFTVGHDEDDDDDIQEEEEVLSFPWNEGGEGGEGNAVSKRKPIFAEMEELIKDKETGHMEWKETARYLKHCIAP